MGIEKLNFDLNLLHVIIHPLYLSADTRDLLNRVVSGVGPVEMHQQILPGSPQSTVLFAELTSFVSIVLVVFKQRKILCVIER